MNRGLKLCTLNLLVSQVSSTNISFHSLTRKLFTILDTFVKKRSSSDRLRDTWTEGAALQALGIIAPLASTPRSGTRVHSRIPRT